MTKEQIEKAANDFADDRCQKRGCPKAYRLHFDFDRYDIEQSFESGANWRINSVWHDADEQPKRNEIYLVQMGKDGFDTFYDSKNWEVFKRDLNITRWAYIEDLLPNTEE